MPPGYAEIPDFFSLCDTTKTCPSLFIHQQTISILCLHRISLGPQMPLGPICCLQPEQVAEDLVQSNSELFYLTQVQCWDANRFEKPIFSTHPSNPTHVGRVTGFFFKSICKIFLPWYGHKVI